MLVLDLPNSSLSDIQLQEYWYNTSDAQKWVLSDATAAGYKVIKSYVSNKALDTSMPTGSPVIQKTYNSTFDAQQWKFVSVGGGYYKIENKANGLVLSINSGKTVVKAYAAENGQQWKLENAAARRAAPDSDVPQGLNVYPNPSHDQLTVVVYAETAQTTTFRLHTVSGARVQSHVQVLRAGRNELTFGLSQPAGMYVLRATVDGKPQSQKVVVE